MRYDVCKSIARCAYGSLDRLDRIARVFAGCQESKVRSLLETRTRFFRLTRVSRHQKSIEKTVYGFLIDSSAMFDASLMLASAAS